MPARTLARRRVQVARWPPAHLKRTQQRAHTLGRVQQPNRVAFESTFAQRSTVHHDPSVWDIFGRRLWGRESVCAPERASERGRECLLRECRIFVRADNFSVAFHSSL